MALSMVLGDAGMTADNIETKAAVSLDEVEGGFEVSAIHLDLVARIPGADKAEFEKAANAAKDNCPISKLMNAKITLDAKLET